MNPKHRHLVIDGMDVEGEEEEWGKGDAPASFPGWEGPVWAVGTQWQQTQWVWR